MPTLRKVNTAFRALAEALKEDEDASAFEQRLLAKLSGKRGHVGLQARQVATRRSETSEKRRNRAEDSDFESSDEAEEDSENEDEDEVEAVGHTCSQNLEKRRKLAPHEFVEVLKTRGESGAKIFAKRMAKTKRGKGMKVFLESTVKFKDSIHQIIPPVSSQMKAFMRQVGFERNEMILEPLGNVCACLGCQHMEEGGWAQQLAITLHFGPGKGSIVRLHALRSLEIIDDIFAVKNKKKFCKDSFEVAMAVRKSLELCCEKSGGYNHVNATKLRSICVAIARMEVGRRLVLNHCLPPVESKHVSKTREMFKALQPLHKMGRMEKVVAKFLLDNYSIAQENDEIDLLAWEELLHGHRKLGTPGNKMHIVSCCGLFEGRCLASDETALSLESCNERLLDNFNDYEEKSYSRT